ncbi:hypothetical protein NLN62_24940 [Bradyrhizobium sp. CCGUVB23]|nr:hypothetical protein [Bradyrhizobium sp. CCGUVB23]MCP3463494.1 hypothetical protein [Bradyrhizobium sp. CCGUVB23]
MNWGSFAARFGWNNRRRFLLRGMHRALSNLRAAGCVAAIIDGSFVTNKEEPGDYDLAFDPMGMNGGLVDPVLRRHDDGRKAMKAKYFGEVFPWGAEACAVTRLIYLDFFQRDRSGVAKGVVLLDVKLLP